MRNHKPNGYVILISVLIIGAVALSVAVTLLFYGTELTVTSANFYNSELMQSATDGCAEIALQRLHDNPGYTGNETITFPPPGSRVCTIGAVLGTGNTNRTVQVTAVVNGMFGRIQIVIATLSPTLVISSWQDVTDF